MDKENFILAFQIDNDKLFNGLIDYHKNNHEYKYKSEHTTHDVETKASTDVNIHMSSIKVSLYKKNLPYENNLSIRVEININISYRRAK